MYHACCLPAVAAAGHTYRTLRTKHVPYGVRDTCCFVVHDELVTLCTDKLDGVLRHVAAGVGCCLNLLSVPNACVDTLRLSDYNRRPLELQGYLGLQMDTLVMLTAI